MNTKNTIWILMALLVMVTVTACSSAEPNDNTPDIHYEAPVDQTCLSTISIYYKDSGDNVVEVASMEHTLHLVYKYDETRDGRKGYYLYFTNDRAEDLNQADIDALREELDNFIETVNHNIVSAGFPWIEATISSVGYDIGYIYDGEPDENLSLDYWYNDTPPYSLDAVCADVNVAVPISLSPKDSGWRMYGNKLEFSDDQSTVIVEVPKISFFVDKGYNSGYSGYLENHMEIGDPAVISYPKGSFRLVYGSPYMSYIRAQINVLPYQAIYQTQSDGLTFGVFVSP